MKKFLYVLGMGVCIAVLWYMFDQYLSGQKKTKDVEVFQITDAVFQTYGIYDCECEIGGCYYYGEEFLSEESAHELLGKIAGEIGISGEYQYVRNQTDTGFQTEITKSGEESDFKISLNTVEKKTGSTMSQSQYILIDLKIKNSVSSGIYYRDQIHDVIGKYVNHKGKNTTDLCIRGNICGLPGKKIQKKIAASVFEEAEAKKVFEHVEDESYSIYGYTDKVDNCITIGNKKININVAFSYNEEKNITQILIGSPIVNYDY